MGQQTLFERSGGFSVVRKIVSDFYDRVLEHESLQRHFAGADMRSLIDHQTKFVAFIMGGPASFTDDALRKAHARLAIDADDFAAIVELLCETLEDHDIADEDVSQVRRKLEQYEAVILGQDKPGAGGRHG